MATTYPIYAGQKTLQPGKIFREPKENSGNPRNISENPKKKRGKIQKTKQNPNNFRKKFRAFLGRFSRVSKRGKTQPKRNGNARRAKNAPKTRQKFQKTHRRNPQTHAIRAAKRTNFAPIRRNSTKKTHGPATNTHEKR